MGSEGGEGKVDEVAKKEGGEGEEWEAREGKER
jgi:hypothetical protein